MYRILLLKALMWRLKRLLFKENAFIASDNILYVLIDNRVCPFSLYRSSSSKCFFYLKIVYYAYQTNRLLDAGWYNKGLGLSGLNSTGKHKFQPVVLN
jgi:hypothetical protein